MRLSRFRRLEELPGRAAPVRLPGRVRVRVRRPSTPASSRTTTSTGRRSASSEESTFVNLMTSNARLARRRARRISPRTRIRAGEWPWSFFCWPEDRPRPVFPSAFRLLADSGVGRARRRRRALPGVRTRVGEPRDAGARRRAVPQRPRDRRRRPSLRARASAHARRVPPELYSSTFDARRLDLRQTRLRDRPRRRDRSLCMCADRVETQSAVAGRLLRAGAARAGDRPRPHPAPRAGAGAASGPAAARPRRRRGRRGRSPNPATPATTNDVALVQPSDRPPIKM